MTSENKMNDSYKILQGDVLDVLRGMKSESVQMTITSPPYYNLRDYQVEGQLGLEGTIGEYIAKLVEICREVKRVLRNDGVFFLNIGDSYVGGNGFCHGAPSNETSRSGQRGQKVYGVRLGVKPLDGLKPKDIVGVPWMLAFALRADGWWLRQDIIWKKVNPMPESVTDRCTKAHEYVFLLTKSAKYFYDADAVRKPYAGAAIFGNAPGKTEHNKDRRDGDRHNVPLSASGSNLRSVWDIATQPFGWEMCKTCKRIYSSMEYRALKTKIVDKQTFRICKCGEHNEWLSHFAVFPEKLVEPCILAGSSQAGCCPKCGAPWKRVMEKRNGKSWHDHSNDEVTGQSKSVLPCNYKQPQTLGWAATCKCYRLWDFLENSDTLPCIKPETRGPDYPSPVPCTVLDPFSGSGTTGVVAIKHGRNYVGIELNPDYVKMSLQRLKCTSTGLTLREKNAGQTTMFGESK